MSERPEFKIPYYEFVKPEPSDLPEYMLCERGERLSFHKWIEDMGVQARAVYPYIVGCSLGAYVLETIVMCTYPEPTYPEGVRVRIGPFDAEPSYAEYDMTFLRVRLPDHEIPCILHRLNASYGWTLIIMDPNFNNEDELSHMQLRDAEHVAEIVYVLFPGIEIGKFAMRRGANVNVPTHKGYKHGGLCGLALCSFLRAGQAYRELKKRSFGPSLITARTLLTFLFVGNSWLTGEELLGHSYPYLKPRPRSKQRSPTPLRDILFLNERQPFNKAYILAVTSEHVLWSTPSGSAGTVFPLNNKFVRESLQLSSSDVIASLYVMSMNLAKMYSDKKPAYMDLRNEYAYISVSLAYLCYPKIYLGNSSDWRTLQPVMDNCADIASALQNMATEPISLELLSLEDEIIHEEDIRFYFVHKKLFRGYPSVEDMRLRRPTKLELYRRAS